MENYLPTSFNKLISAHFELFLRHFFIVQICITRVSPKAKIDKTNNNQWDDLIYQLTQIFLRNLYICSKWAFHYLIYRLVIICLNITFNTFTFYYSYFYHVQWKIIAKESLHNYIHFIVLPKIFMKIQHLLL